MDTIVASITAIWVALLAWLSQIILPNWNDVLRWIPSMLLGLVGLVIAVLVFAWLRNRRVTASRMIPVRREGAPPPGVHMPGASRWPIIIPLGLALVFSALVFHPGHVASPVITGGQVVTEAAPPITDLVNLPLLLLGLVIAVAGVVGWYRDAGREWHHVEDPAWHPPASSGASGEAPTREILPAGMHLPGPSPWPFLAPLGMGVIFVGLVYNPVFIVAGVLMAVIAAAGWYLDAGREYRAVEAGHPLDGSQVEPASRLPNALLGIYATIGVLAIVIAGVPSFVAWVNPAPTQAPAASLSPNQTVIAQSVLGFAETSMTVPAGVPLVIDFQNADTGVQHNWAIYDPADGSELFKGPILVGPAAATLQVKALQPGTYKYVCDIHPQTMTGTLTSQ
jgi:plastocyanin